MATLDTTKTVVANGDIATHPSFEPYDGNEPFCFVSYSHANSSSVYSVLNELDDNNFRLWFDDSMEIGDDFRKELRERIAACDAFILFISDESMSSKYCGMEIITAHQMGKRIYPVQLNETTSIPNSLKLILETLQHVKAHTGEARYIRKLVESLPPDTMRRLVVEDGVISKCADHGSQIIVPDGITAIGDDAFKECIQLESVELPSTLKSIGDQAFRGCTRLKSIVLGPNVEYVGHSAFRDCLRLQSVTIENPDVVLAGRAFENCAELNQISLPETSTEIFEAAFNSCGRLTSFDFPRGLKIIGEAAFADCAQLNDLVIPEDVVKIDAGAFGDCTSLKSIELSPALSKIGRYCFKGCSSLESIEIPVRVNSLNGDAFRECVNLKSIQVDPANRFYKAVDGVLFNKSRAFLVAYPSARQASSYEVPDSVTIINDWAFCQADQLQSIALADSLEEIGEGAFYSASSLEEIVLPPSLERIDDIAFRDCVGLRRVEVPEHVWHIGWGAFLGCPKIEVICEVGTYAWRYCEANEIPHQEPSGV